MSFYPCLYDYGVSSLTSFRAWGLQSTGCGLQGSTHSPYLKGDFAGKRTQPEMFSDLMNNCFSMNSSFC